MVQTGGKNIELATMKAGETMKVSLRHGELMSVKDFSKTGLCHQILEPAEVENIVSAIEKEKEEAEKKKKAASS